MSRMLSIAVALALAVGAPNTAWAQSVFNPNPPIGAPYSRPALSPYLNLLRGGDSAANYYLGVLTEYDRRYQLTKPLLVPESVQLDPYVDDRIDLEVQNRQLPPTGHTAGFMIFNSYYRMPNQRSFVPYQQQSGGNRPPSR